MDMKNYLFGWRIWLQETTSTEPMDNSTIVSFLFENLNIKEGN